MENDVYTIYFFTGRHRWRGAAGTDMNAIPLTALQTVEVLRGWRSRPIQF